MTRCSSDRARGRSNQWNAWPAKAASTFASGSGTASADPSIASASGTTTRSCASIGAPGSTAATSKPSATRPRVSFPVPAPTSRTRAPGASLSRSAAQRNASSGYSGRCRSYSAATDSKLRARSDTARRAEVADDAVLAARPARIADAATVPDQEVREAAPVGTRHEPQQIALDLHRVLLAGEPQPLREAPDVRVDHDPLRLPQLSRDDVTGLPRDARQPDQLFEARRHLAVELLEQRSHRPAQRLRLLPVETGREDVALELLLRDGEVVLGLAVLLEQRLGDAVDVHVGRLRREHHGDEQLERAAEAERDRRVGVFGREPLDDRAYALLLRPDALASLSQVATRQRPPGAAGAAAGPRRRDRVRGSRRRRSRSESAGTGRPGSARLRRTARPRARARRRARRRLPRARPAARGSGR